MITQMSSGNLNGFPMQDVKQQKTRHRYYGAYWGCEDQAQFTVSVVLLAFDDWAAT
jgi:hypothetical protein